MASILGRDGPASAAEFDLVIMGGRIVDGTGNPWFEAEIGITGGRIVELGRIDWTRELVERAIKDGAVGFSTGLEYFPGSWARTNEIVELAGDAQMVLRNM